MGNSTGNADKKTSITCQKKDAGMFRNKKVMATQEKITAQRPENTGERMRFKRYRQRVKFVLS